MKFFWRRYRRRQDEDSFIEQFARFIGARHTADRAGGRFVVVNPPRLFRKSFADVLRLARHRKQGAMQSLHAVLGR